ncbi:MAG: ABC transporter permease [Candidatus Saccharibacteria bacterium]|nr:ABC transporter permease [Candidatus Saccharibacteria bacterium]
MMLFDHIENAYETLRRNRTRSVLTTLGITIGIASVTCILALSGGVSRMIGAQIAEHSGQLIVVRPGLQSRDPNAIMNPVAQQSFSTSTLTETDVAELSKLEGIETAVPVMTINGTLKSSSETVSDNVILATTPDFATIAGVKMRTGQFLDNVTDNSTAVVGEQLAIDLFGTNTPVGQTFTLRNETFTVIGVIRQSQNPINYNNVDLNNAAVVSFERGKLFHQGRAQIQQIDLLAKKDRPVGEVRQRVEQKLLQQHLGERDFTVASGDEISRPTNALFTALTQVLTAIAAISLLVGGIGVMNIMLVGVAERTREIGIRKAVGASNGTIVTQFLIESLLMSLLGGILGYCLGYLAAFALSTFLYFAPAFTWLTAGMAFAMAVLVGVLFGLYPALKASRKDTIESLRQYH